MNDADIARSISVAAELIQGADGLLITAGAGIGVDSGLPDFRGDQGFWKAYPPLAEAGIGFMDIARQATFEDQPRLAWGFYGHRLQLYRDTVPHAGFGLLQAFGAQMANGSFVYTSNVDGQFQKAGFDAAQIVECHGSIHHLQCLAACKVDIWPADELVVDVDEATCTLRSDLPRCPHCGGLARPNILMFEDWTYLSERTDLQLGRLDLWLKTVRHLVVIEMGAGTAIPSVRRKGEGLKVPVIRINPNEWRIRTPDSVSIPLGACEALERILIAIRN